MDSQNRENVCHSVKNGLILTFSVEYILGSGSDGLVNFVQKMEYTTMFETPTTKPNSIVEIRENSKS